MEDSWLFYHCDTFCYQANSRSFDIFILAQNFSFNLYVCIVTNFTHKNAGILSRFQFKVTHENTFTRELPYLPLSRLWKEICSWVQVKEPHHVSPWKGWYHTLTILFFRKYSLLHCFAFSSSFSVTNIDFRYSSGFEGIQSLLLMEMTPVVEKFCVFWGLRWWMPLCIVFCFSGGV